MRDGIPLFALLGKTIEMVDASESLLIRFTDGSYLEVNGVPSTRDPHDPVERAGIDAYYLGQSIHGRAE